MSDDIHSCSYYCDRPECVKAQRDELRAEVKSLRADAERLRLMLAIRVAGARLYTDDGELSDSTAHPGIDFKRDSVADIERKLLDRGARTFFREFSSAIAAARAEKGPADA